MSNLTAKGTHMKRILLISLIAALGLLIVTPATAQIFGIGVKGGLNFANLRGDLTIIEDDLDFTLDLKNKTGIVVGASFSSSLVPFISLQPEILYSEKGARFEESETIPLDDFGFPGQTAAATIDGTFDLKYVEVPVLLRVGLPVPGFSPFVYAGPSFAYNLSADFKIDVAATFMGESFSETILDEDIKDDIKNFDVGFVIGGGMEFGLPLLKLHAEIRYTMGLSNVIDNNNGNDLDLKNGVFSLMVGVTF